MNGGKKERENIRASSQEFQVAIGAWRTALELTKNTRIRWSTRVGLRERRKYRKRATAAANDDDDDETVLESRRGRLSRDVADSTYAMPSGRK